MTEHQQPEALAAAFAAAYGAPADSLWAAPGRVNVIGEHTDYNDGFVLPVALPHSALLAVRWTTDGQLRIRSAQMPDEEIRAAVAEAEPGRITGWAGYLAGVVWALAQDGHRISGAELLLDSAVPVGAGLSSSAAMESAMALALDAHFGGTFSRPELARYAQRAENDFVGAPTGVLDQMSSLCCTEGHAMFLDTRTMTSRQVPLDLAAQGLRLLVVDTLVKHSHADGEYGKRRAGCEAAAAALGLPALRDVTDLDAALARVTDAEQRRLLRHVVTENGRVERVVELLDAGRIREIGPILSEGHASLRDDYRVSVPELDLAVEAALGAGALGARMTGGGFGGSAVVLVEDAAAEQVSEGIAKAFAEAGHRTPRIFTATPGPGARRLG
jgi:galactokinase